MTDTEKDLDWGLDDEMLAEPQPPPAQPASQPAARHDDVAATGAYQAEGYIPTSFEGWFNLGVYQLDQENLPMAIECFVKAVNFQHDHPDVASAYSNLGVTYAKLGQNQHALDAYRRAVKANPRLIEARWGQVRIYLQMGKLVEAVGQLRRVPANHAQYQLAQNQIKAILAQPQAIPLWETAVRQKPDSPRLHFDLGQLYMIHHLPDRALEHLHRVIELAPDHAEAGALLEVTALDRLEQSKD